MQITRLEWSDEYHLGLPAMDHDHRELLESCNEFLDAVMSGMPVSGLAQIMDRLILRTQAHFLAEERLLDRHSYPGLAVHRAEHDRLVTQAKSLRARLDHPESEETRTVIGDIAVFLQAWLVEHIRSNDRPYRPYLRKLT